ncbi:hypothetical protein EON68_00860 [archaeon]|nr:MAG: hypothetical protein EON68_00860 [archaeon]
MFGFQRGGGSGACMLTCIGAHKVALLARSPSLVRFRFTPDELPLSPSPLFCGLHGAHHTKSHVCVRIIRGGMQLLP